MSVFLQPIYTQTVGSGGAASITFNSIPQTFTDLFLKVSARDTGAGTQSDFQLRFNGTGAGVTTYSDTVLYGSGSSAVSSRHSGTSVIYISGVPGSSATANTFGNAEVYIPNYTSSNYKQVVIDSLGENNATTSYLFIDAGLWRDTSSISSITVVAGVTAIAQYSTFSLYGITKG